METTILGIETSCDETAAAVYTTSRGIISNELFSQGDIHAIWGGTVPEIASRSHLEKIRPIIELALLKADCTLKDISAIAVTSKPGLPGSLLVGLSFAKAIAWASDIPLIGVNHVEGHMFSACIEHIIPFPFTCLTVSGGHTSICIIEDYGDYSTLGQTLDDAAGEALDKIAKFMNLPYPGGPVIEKLAQEAQFQDFFQYPRPMQHTFDFSFSGLKTAVLYDMVKRGAYDLKKKEFLKNDDLEFKQKVASSIMVCMGDIFEHKLARIFKKHPTKAVAFVGGVACNTYLRERLKAFSERHGKQFFVPSRQYCTDNGAMIAYVGHYKALKKEYAPLTLDIFEE